MDSYHFIVNIEAAIVRDGRYLIVKRGPDEDHAAGALSLVGGKIEAGDRLDNAVEATLHREIYEEVGLRIHDEFIYLDSVVFTADDNQRAANFVFMVRYKSGEVHIDDPGEVAFVSWRTAADILADPDTPPWTRRSIALAEQKRGQLGW